MSKPKPDHAGDGLPKLSAAAQRARASAGIKNLPRLARKTEEQIKQLHGIGPNALKQLRAALKAKGLRFKRPD